MANGLHSRPGPCNVPGASQQLAELTSLRSHGIEALRIFEVGLARPPTETATVRKEIIEDGRIQRQRCDKLTETGALLHSYPVIKLLQEALPSRISGGSNRTTFKELANSSASPGSFRVGFLRTTPQRSFSRES